MTLNHARISKGIFYGAFLVVYELYFLDKSVIFMRGYIDKECIQGFFGFLFPSCDYFPLNPVSDFFYCFYDGILFCAEVMVFYNNSCAFLIHAHKCDL